MTTAIIIMVLVVAGIFVWNWPKISKNRAKIAEARTNRIKIRRENPIFGRRRRRKDTDEVQDL